MKLTESVLNKRNSAKKSLSARNRKSNTLKNCKESSSELVKRISILARYKRLPLKRLFLYKSIVFSNPMRMQRLKSLNEDKRLKKLLKKHRRSGCKMLRKSAKHDSKLRLSRLKKAQERRK